MFPSPLIDDNGYLRGDLLPHTNQINLGSESNPFAKIYVNEFAGNVTIPAGGGFQATAGAAESLHTVTLVAGTATVANPNITATSKLFLSRKTAGGTLGDLSYTLNAGVGYTVNSTSNTDTSTVDVLIVKGL